MSKSLFSRAGAAGAIALLVSFVGGWEGLRTKAYLDPVGIPTICYGETKGVKLGQIKTKEQCTDLLMQSLKSHERDMLKYLKVTLPNKTHIVHVSFAYNVGGRTYGKSSVLRLANEGDLKGSCAALKKYVYAKGKRLKGLENRRAAEYQLCMEGIAEIEPKSFWSQLLQVLNYVW